MDRLAGFLARRRGVVLAAWLVVLRRRAAVRRAQTEHLTSGGFDVPGSQSQVVDQDLEPSRAPSATTSPSCCAPRAARRPPRCAPRSTASGGRRATAARRAHAAGRGRAASADAGQGVDHRRPARARRHRDELGRRRGRPARRARHGRAQRRRAAPRRPAGALGRHAGPLQGGPRERRDDRLPDRAPDPARRLRLAGGRGAAARARLRAASSSPAPAIYFLSQATPMSVFVTNIASMIGIGVAVDYSLFVLARYREEIRGGARPRGGAARRYAHVGHRRRVLRASP